MFHFDINYPIFPKATKWLGSPIEKNNVSKSNR